MAYIKPLDRSQVDTATGATLDAVKAKLGVLPNMAVGSPSVAPVTLLAPT